MKFFLSESLAKLTSLLIVIVFLSACNDETSSIGSSLVTDKSEITIDSIFTVAGRSVATHELRSRTLTQLIGSIDAQHFGSLESDYVTQLMPSATMDTTGVSEATLDSIKLVIRFYSNKITGDSMTPMGINVYTLTRQLPSSLMSSFDPTGYYDESAPLASAIYTGNTLYSDSLEHMGVHIIECKLPIEIARQYFRAYKADPSVFSSPEAFAKIFPGIYVANSFGQGRVTNIFNTRVLLNYHSNTTYTNSAGEERDTTIYSARIIAASTPEVLTNNNLTFNIAPELDQMAKTAPMLVSPLGYESEIKFPSSQVIASFKAAADNSMGVVNSLVMRIPVEKIANEYGIEPPAHLLLIPTRDRDKFFAEQMIPDNVTSFVTDYDTEHGLYSFGGLRAFIMKLMQEGMTAEEIEDISTFSLVPVEITTESYTNSSYQQVSVITAVGPHIESPAMAKISTDDIKILLTYSTETINF